MNVVLVGTGRMGRAIEQVAERRGHRIVARFDADNPFVDSSRSDFPQADVAIDFTKPDLGPDHIRHAISLSLPIVVGTTGWYDRLDDVRSAVESNEDASVLYAANFSLGIAVMRRALAAMNAVVNHIEEFDLSIHEAHHTGKVDSPSGTALLLARDTLAQIDRKSRIETETVHGEIDSAALHVTASRVGRVFGRHTITIDSETDELTLEHRAKSRDGFAAGAVRAAEWLLGRTGLFTLDDAIDSWIASDQTP